MEDWSNWLLNSMVERASESTLCTTGELAVVAMDRPQPPAWWAAQLESSPRTARYLVRMANSAAYGRTGQEARDVFEAVEILTHHTARHLVFTELLGRMFPARGRDWIHTSWRWRHVLAVASAAAELARSARMPAGEVFVAGLLHDIGKLLLLEQGGKPYERLEKSLCEDADSRTLAQEEREHLGFDNAMLGASIVARWGLSPMLVSMIRDHDRLEELQEQIAMGSHLRRVALLDLAEKYACALGYGVRDVSAIEDPAYELGEALSEMADSAAARILGFSRLRLRWVSGRISRRIGVVCEIARGGEGELWSPPGWLERMAESVHGLGFRLRDALVALLPSGRRQLAEGSETSATRVPARVDCA